MVLIISLKVLKIKQQILTNLKLFNRELKDLLTLKKDHSKFHKILFKTKLITMLS